MFSVGILSWWYGAGFVQRLHSVADRLGRTADFFSIVILLKTLFSPYKQISASGAIIANESWAQKIVDKIISRVVGFFARSFLIIAGTFIMLFQVLMGGIILVFWFIIPLLPIIGLIMAVIGWVPEWKI